ncbi:carcinoembryonic antigen-related cell adhesion molecule 1 [Enoplosus armatus]|uniref:carcinoembryonic antigen-related cell adhesion molecule 1 n=1 Tax=Enoplosus armatus TaxID=215367 RepID=UPI003992A65B
MALTVNGQNTASFSTGSNLTMLCSAQSNPPAQLQWAFRGELVNTTGPLLELFTVREDQSGPYSCLAFNNHTNTNSNITTHIVIAGIFQPKKKLNSKMEFPVVFVLILATITFATAPAYSQGIYASENPLAVGSEVTLFSPSNVATGAWFFNSDIIVWILPGNIIISNTWSARVTFNSTTSSLTISSLQVEDSGLYTLQEVNSFRDQFTLSVQVPISNVTLRANATNLVEFNDTVVFMCSVSNGSSLSYAWLDRSSVVTAGGRVQLSDGGATLTIVRVTRYDEGPFMCNASNGINHEISNPVHLNISYGPSNTTMMIMPMRYTYRTGSNITLSCSTESSPPAMVQWMVDGMYLDQFHTQLQLEEVTESNSGNYQCVFHSTVTSRISSASAMIRILEPLAAVVVNRTDGPAILHEPFTLHCEVTGSADNIQWWRNGQFISADNTTVFGMGNKTLILNPVQHSDKGDYQCKAFNSVSNMTSSRHTVEVNYGPMKPVITGPSMALTGTWETLNCSSSSHPLSHISWYFNDSLVASTSELVIGPLTLNMSGKYICMAFNNITGKNSSAYTMFTVLAPVTMASIKIVGAQPILNHTFTLTCETAGSVESIIWMHGWSPLYADNTRNLSMDNATLTFDPVMYSDNGNYSCVASNPLSNSTSEIFMLDVFYGPHMPTIMGSNVAKTGDNVTLSCYASSNPLSFYKWFFNDSLVANTSEYVTPPLTIAMSGMYTCMAHNNITGKNSTAYTMLTVVDPITDVQVETSTSPAIEGHFYMLKCNVTGPAEHVYWMKNYEPLHEDNRTVLDNKTVTFNPLEHNNTGYYQCRAINAVGNMTSPPYKLVVNFGPETPMIDSPDFAETGHNAVFRCSAMSMPPSQFSWWFNGSKVGNTSVFTTGLLSFNMSGYYTCMAYNSVTGKNSTNSKMLTVIEAIESVMIRNNTVPINSENFTLTCEVTGPYEKIYWKIHLNTNTTTAIIYYHLRNMLYFTPLTTNNDGIYQCVATNQAGSHESPKHTLLVNYGPRSVYISGPDSAKVGSSVSLTCSADSRPDCDFYWFLNNQSSGPLKTGSVITFSATEENEGNYICKARNPVTNITVYQTKAFTVTGHASALHIPSQGGLMLMGLFALSVTAVLSPPY